MFNFGSIWAEMEQLILKAITHQVVEGLVTVVQADLFALGVSTAVIDDWHLIDSDAEFGDLHGHLGFHAEAVRVQMHAFQQFAPEYLIAGSDIMDGDASEQVANDGEQPVYEEPVVTLHTVRAAVETVSEDG